ncbi:dienelactone hydrolase family protein [Methylocystis suflitae]|uniref:dienelactone hydrolase family protein n=1 Tax=Methylocystis suflitae TaxID=2951405 RepID=UPI0021091D61|nr:alpha/beta family hydrolase [Methylocystis suflitae]MCQ4189742.1 dienelactone hydrolase family protein [Methylocystis suflitae]
MTSDFTTADVAIGPHRLEGSLYLPQSPQGLVIFAHGSGSSRFSPRNRYVAERLVAQGFACLLFDLLTATEGELRRNVFDIELLGARVSEAIDWTRDSDIGRLPIGLFGASTGAAAALVAAADEPRVAAVVSRGGRPDLAGDALRRVQAPTLLIVGGLDYGVIELNRSAQQLLRCRNRLDIVPGATHLFEEPGTLESAVERATKWFVEHLCASRGAVDE